MQVGKAQTAEDQYGSVFGVLNRCVTRVGTRLLQRWLNKMELKIRLIYQTNKRLIDLTNTEIPTQPKHLTKSPKAPIN